MNTPIDPTKAYLSLELKHARPLIGCRFDPSGRYLFVSSEDESIQRFDLLSRKRTPFVGHPSWVRGLAFRPSSGTAKRNDSLRQAFGLVLSAGAAESLPLDDPAPFQLFSGDYHGNVFCFAGDAENPTVVRKWAGHDGWIRAVGVSPDGKLVATCGNDQLVKLWSADDGKEVRTLKGHQAHVYNVAFHPEGKELISADLLGNLLIWDAATGQLNRQLEAKEFSKYDPSFRAIIGGIRGISFFADGSTVACSGITNVSNAFAGVGNPLVMLIDWKTAKTKTILKPKAAFQGTAWGVACHPSGIVIGAGGGNGGQVWFWKPDDPTSFHTITAPQSIRDVALHPGGEIIATAGSDGTARIYRLTPRGETPPPPAKK